MLVKMLVKGWLILLLLALDARPYLYASPSVPMLDPGMVPDLKPIDALINSPEMQEHLYDRNLHRPAKCPLQAAPQLWEIHNKLEVIASSLKYGECYNNNQELIDGFNSLLAERANIMQRFKSKGQAIPLPTAEGASPVVQSAQNQQIFNTLSTVTQDSDCMMNIKKRGLLPVIADVATNLGLVASIMPTPNGFLIGSMGIALGSALRILNSVFKSKFNWQQASDRKQFLDLNCAFFDLRRDIESAELVDFQDRLIDAKLASAKVQQQRLIQALNDNQTQREHYLEKVNEITQSYFKNAMGLGPYLIFGHLEEVLPALEKMQTCEHPSPQKSLNHVELVHAFTLHFPPMMGLINQEKNLPPYFPYLKSLLAEFDWTNLATFNEWDMKHFGQKYAYPLAFYLKKYAEELHSQILELEKVFFNQPIVSTGMTNRCLHEKVLDTYALIEERLKATTARIATRIALLETKERKLMFDAYDTGVHTTYDILEEYEYIQQILFGSLGQSFIRYFKKQIRLEFREFERNLQPFFDRYPELPPEVAPRHVLWACRDASKLRVSWEKANAAREIIYDYISTNTGIFYSRIRRVKTFLHFLPVGRTKQNSLFRDINSAEYAIDIINQKRTYYKKEMRGWGLIPTRNLGELFLSMHDSQADRKQLEAFWEKHHCPELL